MTGRVCILVALVVSLIGCAQTRRIRLERAPQDVLTSFLIQESVKVCPFKMEPLASHKPLTSGALVLTSERLLVYRPPESLLPSCNPLSWDKLKTDYSRGRHFMYNHDGVLEEAQFESCGVHAVRYTPLKSPPGLQEAPFESSKFHPLEGEKLPSYKSVWCAYPEEVASIAIETISMRHLFLKENFDNEEEEHHCYVISGCPDDECKQNRVEWTACLVSHNVDMYMTPLYRAIVSAHLKKNDIKELLGPAFEWALFFRGNIFASHPNLHEISAAFTRGIIPKKNDPNSRSGAAFFYSADKKYIAKRIRDCEFQEGLLALAAGGKYSQHIREGSALCPTYMGFKNMEENWIVMRREQLPPYIKELLHARTNLTGVRSFFADIKPHPMVSDRLEFHDILGKEFLEKGFRLANLHGWGDVLKTVDADIKFLQAAELVDYSFWIYGTLFDLHSMPQKDEWEKSMFDIMSGKPDSERRHPLCAYGCQNPRTNPLEDLTRTMGTENQLHRNGLTFKCCCAELSATTYKPESPCVLVDMNKLTSELTLVRNRTGCGNLLGQGWHSYYQSGLQTNGKCLVGTGLGTEDLWIETPHIYEHIVFPDDLWPPRAEPLNTVSRFPWRCGVVCVSIGDYFLHLGGWEKFENMALTLWYQAQKWSDYPEKMLRLLHSLQGSTPFGDDFVDAIRGGMAQSLNRRVESFHA